MAVLRRDPAEPGRTIYNVLNDAELDALIALHKDLVIQEQD